MVLSLKQFESICRTYQITKPRGLRFGQWFVNHYDKKIPDALDVSDIFYEPSTEKAKTMIRERFVSYEIPSLDLPGEADE